MREHFSRFGAVESIHMNDLGVFVEFKDKAGAARALQQQDHRISNQMVPKLYDPLQPFSKLLNTLDDDCMEAIFKHLPLKDLCNAAEVCKRFKRNAEQRFKSHYANKIIISLHNLVQNDETCKCKRIEATPDQDFSVVDWKFDFKFIEQLLRNFGSFIISFCAVDDEDDEKHVKHEQFLSLVNQHCAGTLKELRLFGLIGLLNSSFRVMFAGLEKLEICFHSEREDESLRNLLSNCSELRVLRIKALDDSLMVNFPKLIRLEFFNSDCLTNDMMDNMMRLNGNIEILTIWNCSKVSSKVFRHIANRLPKLQRLEFLHFREWVEGETEIQENLFELSRIKSLKELSIDCKKIPLKSLVDSFVNAHVPLEKLTACYAKIDLELLKSLASLNSLKVLEISAPSGSKYRRLM